MRAPSLEDAFALLAEREPRLIDVREHVRATRWDLDSGGGLASYLDTQLQKLVGISARSHDELLRSDLADSIAQQYLLILACDPGFSFPPGAFDVKKSFFEAPLRSEIHSSSVFGRKRRTAN